MPKKVAHPLLKRNPRTRVQAAPGSTVKLTIPGQLPGWNQLLDAAASHPAAYYRLKKTAMERVAMSALAARVPHIRSGVFQYAFYEPDERRDPSNVISGALKIIEDALQRVGCLENDGRKNVLHVAPSVYTDREKPRIELLVLGCNMEGEDNDRGKGGKAA